MDKNAVDQEKILDGINTLTKRMEELMDRFDKVGSCSCETATLQATGAILDETTLELLKGWVKHKAAKTARKEVEDTVDLVKKLKKEVESMREDLDNLSDEVDDDDTYDEISDQIDDLDASVDELQHLILSQGIVFQKVIGEVLALTGHSDTDVEELCGKYADEADKTAWAIIHSFNCECEDDEDDEDDDDDDGEDDD